MDGKFELTIQVKQKENSEILHSEFPEIHGYSHGRSIAEKVIVHSVSYSLHLEEMAEITDALRRINAKRIKIKEAHEKRNKT